METKIKITLFLIIAAILFAAVYFFFIDDREINTEDNIINLSKLNNTEAEDAMKNLSENDIVILKDGRRLVLLRKGVQINAGDTTNFNGNVTITE